MFLDKKVVVWGVGNHFKNLLNNFEGLEKHIHCFLDSYSLQNDFVDIEVKMPEEFTQYNEYPVVIAVKNGFCEIYNLLLKKFGCKKDNIFSTDEWICYLIKKKLIKLRPVNVRLDVCTLCQLNCKYCYMRTENNGVMGSGYLKFEDFQFFLDKENYIKSIEISNSGEVFLNPDLKKIIQYAYEKNVEITIGNGTNFNTVSDEMLEILVKYKVKFINISIDGASQDVYSIYRINGDYNNVIENIKKLNKLKERYHSQYPILQWQYILMQHNEKDVKKAYELSKELNMNIFFKFDCLRDGFIPKNRKILEQVTGYKYFSVKEYNQNNVRMYDSEICYQTIFSPQINYDGRLLGCCMIWREDLGINVFEKGLKEAVNSDEYLTIVEKLLGIDRAWDKTIICGHCSHLGDNLRRENFVYL